MSGPTRGRVKRGRPSPPTPRRLRTFRSSSVTTGWSDAVRPELPGPKPGARAPAPDGSALGRGYVEGGTREAGWPDGSGDRLLRGRRTPPGHGNPPPHRGSGPAAGH